MRTAETVLEVICDRGSRGLPLERVYRLLFNPDLYLHAYGKLYRNAGAMTPGTTAETVDGMSLATIRTIIEALRFERYRWTPVRRTYIAKAHTTGHDATKKRPLGIPTWSDKLLQEVLRLILEAYYEPHFSDCSHGFRPGRGCHTALSALTRGWKGTAWFIEGDIAACFDRLDHGVLLGILAERIHDGRFLRLIEQLLQAGYLEDWRFSATLSGTPQGGVVSPLLANIYLDRLDRYVATTLLPAYTRGTERHNSPAYKRLRHRRDVLTRTGRVEEARLAQRQLQRLPSRDPQDPHYRRLHYVRYADDFLLGFSGPREEAEGIKRQLGEFLRDQLKLELSQAKTLVTHARTEAAHFLGYEVVVHQNDTKHDRHGHRSTNGVIGFKVPVDVVRAKCQPYLRHGEPAHRSERLNDSPFSIVAQYAAEYRGLVEYYRLAYNLHRFSTLRWVMEQSLAKTLAGKLKTSVARVYDRYQTVAQTPHGPRKVLRVTVERGAGKPPLTAQWGDLSLVYTRNPSSTVLNDQPLRVWNVRTEVEQRLLADTCELCGSHDHVEVHHIRALKDLHVKGRAEKPAWVQLMAARRRKTLVVCHVCHQAIHRGRLAPRTPLMRERRGQTASEVTE